MAKKLEEDLAFRVQAAGNFQKHRTICELRRRHLEEFRKLFVKVVGLAREQGVGSTSGKLLIAGPRCVECEQTHGDLRAAWGYGAPSDGGDRGVAADGGRDGREGRPYGEANRMDEVPKELRRRKTRLAAIQAAKERLEAEQRAADDARGRRDRIGIRREDGPTSDFSET